MMPRMVTVILMALGVVSTTMQSGCGFPDPDTPLTRAVETGDAEAVRILLEKGADPNQADSHGLTPLCRVARNGRVEVARALLNGGADPNLRDGPDTRPGWTPLMNAAHKGQVQVIKALLEAHADVNLKSGGGTTALMLATGENESEIVRLLLEAGADPHPGIAGSAALTNAVANCQLANVKALLESAPDLRLEAGIRGRAALWLARVRGHGDIVRLLETAGPGHAGGAPRSQSTSSRLAGGPSRS